MVEMYLKMFVQVFMKVVLICCNFIQSVNRAGYIFFIEVIEFDAF